MSDLEPTRPTTGALEEAALSRIAWIEAVKLCCAKQLGHQKVVLGCAHS